MQIKRKFTILIFLILFQIGCTFKHVQVFETSSNTLKPKKNMFCYENDTVKVLYDFWSQQGLIKFEIFNKTKQPIYVDWKKSSYISNKFKLNYYRDGETIESKSLLANYYFKPNYTPNEIAMGSTSSIVTKDERITFIPPNSKIQKAQFYILPISRLNMSPSTFFYETERNDNPTKKTIIYIQNYTEENSPIAFRNFLTFSFDESFKTEFYVDNDFYVETAKEVELKHFEIDKPYINQFGIKESAVDENGNLVKFSPFFSPMKFYIYLPENVGFKSKKTIF
jgi:hypothetical protein